MKANFPWISAGLGLTLTLVLISSGVFKDPAERGLPLLTTLFITEFGFLVTAAGAFISGRSFLETERSRMHIFLTVVCGALALAFFILGLLLWQETAAQAIS
jgi:formate hydrogenlyase subunit 4